MVLPLRLRGRAGEPPHGLALRAATRHRSASAAAFLADQGMDFHDARCGRLSGELGALTGCEDACVGLEVDVAIRSVRMGDERLLLNDWSTRARRWCPACLAHDRAVARSAGEPVLTAAWHRSAWDVRSIRSCPLHRVLLADACRACGAAPGWDGPAVDWCACGGDLTHSSTRALDAAEGLADAWIAGRLGLGAGISIPMLENDSLQSALPSVERLGWTVLLGYRAQRPRASDEARWAARDAGVAALSAWPGPLVLALDRVVAGRDAPERRVGLIGGYGWIHSEWAYHEPRCELDRRLRLEIRGHAVANRVIPADEPVYGGMAGPTINMTAAARELGMDYGRARDLLDGAGVVPTGVRRGVAFPLRHEEVSAAAAGRLRVPSRSDLRARLGVGKTQARDLGTAFGRPGESGHDWVAPLLEACRSAPPLLRPAPGSAPLPTACRSVGLSVVAACRSIVAGRLQTLGVLSSDATLRGVIVSTAALRDLKGDDLISVERAARRLALHPDAVRWLVRQGHLEGRGARVLADAVAAFGREHVPAAQLAPTLATSPRALIRRLRDAGLAPTFGPPACRQAIYRRAEALRLVALLDDGCGATIH